MLEVRDAAGRQVDLDATWDPSGQVPVKGRTMDVPYHRPLDPDATFDVPISNWAGALLPAGRYLCRARYANARPTSSYTSRIPVKGADGRLSPKRETVRLWRGEIRSNEVSIEVEPATPQHGR